MEVQKANKIKIIETFILRNIEYYINIVNLHTFFSGYM